MDEWVRGAYRKQFCDKNGQPIGTVDLDSLHSLLQKQRPDKTQEINDALKK